jgi:predicted nuclease of predicted toxin-antitoxin system
VKVLEWPLLADENIDARVVQDLRSRGVDVSSVRENARCGLDDASVLALALAAGRVILTHDCDFGTLAIHRGERFVGIVYLRPGDLRPPIVLELLDSLGRIDADVSAPFVVVAERRGGETKIRLRERR